MGVRWREALGEVAGHPPSHLELVEISTPEALKERIDLGGVITITRGTFATPIAHMNDCTSLRAIRSQPPTPATGGHQISEPPRPPSGRASASTA